MPLTYTGRHVVPGNGAHPSLIDIAVGLSRQPRFAGQTRRWWSVLDHTLFGDELIKREETLHAKGFGRYEGISGFRLAWLLHDAHESITADVPTDVKRETLLGVGQAKLDHVIADAFFPGGYLRFLTWKDEVHRIDQRALLAEAAVVGPPNAGQHFGAPEKMDPEILRMLLRTVGGFAPAQHPVFGQPPLKSGQEDHPAVQEYLARMNELM